MALLKDGTVKTWGNNDKGQLGITAKPASSTAAVPAPTPATRPTAIAVPELTTVKGITAGASHALALLADGTVMSWGLNDKGQLGDDTVVNKPYPVTVLELRNVTALAGGASHSLALLQDHTLRGWGLNDKGQVGDGTTTQRNTPVQVLAKSGNVSMVAAPSNGSFSLAR